MRAEFPSPRVAVALATLVSVCTAGCAAPERHAEYHDRLAQANRLRLAGDFADAAAVAEGLLSATAPERDRYGLQNFYAAVILAETHSQAADQGPFLGVEGNGSAFAIDGQRSGRNPTAETAHLVAGAVEALRCFELYQSAGSTWQRGADGAPPAEEGQVLIPADVYVGPDGAGGPEAALSRLRARYLATLARLGQTIRFGEVIGEAPFESQFDPPGLIDEDLVALGLDARERFWIAAGMHTWARENDLPTEAFRYGRLAHLILQGDIRPSPERRVAEQMRRWAEQHPEFVFRHPEAPDRDYPDCMTDLESGPSRTSLSYMDFEALPRSGQP